MYCICRSTMSAISMLNPKAEVARAAQALAVNMSGAKVIFCPFHTFSFCFKRKYPPEKLFFFLLQINIFYVHTSLVTIMD